MGKEVITAAMLSVLMMGCAAVPSGSPTGLASIGVEYAWAPESECAYLSPEIRLSGVPAEVTYLQVNVVDLDRPMNNHGGGTIAYNGSTIAKGSVEGIRGPCPPSGEPHMYELTVVAMDKAMKKVASGFGTAQCCR